eukprot:6484588-Amphidinium_carterae.1
MQDPPRIQVYSGNPDMRLSVVQANGTCPSSGLAAHPGAFSPSLATLPESAECTVLCNTAKLTVYSDSTVNVSSLCRCRAG